MFMFNNDKENLYVFLLCFFTVLIAALLRVSWLEKTNMKATNIEWDVDFEEDLENLPTEIEIPDYIEDKEEIADYISDMTGFCHEGFVLED